MIFVSPREASQCTESVAASNSTVRLEIVTLGAIVFVSSPSVLLGRELSLPAAPADLMICAGHDFV